MKNKFLFKICLSFLIVIAFYSLQTTPTVFACYDDASVSVTQALQSTLIVGQNYNFTVHIINNGDTWWWHGGAYQFVQLTNLTIVDPNTGYNYGHYSPSVHTNWDDRYFTFTLTAPSTPGAYTLTMQNVHYGWPGGWANQMLTDVGCSPQAGYSVPPCGELCSPGVPYDNYFGNSVSLSFTVVYAPINGGWCGWSAINPACGYSGTQTRTCACPSPAYGGADCSGPSTQAYTNPQCLPVITSLSVSPNPVPYGGTTNISYSCNYGYYSHILLNGVWDWNVTGYFGSGTFTTPSLTSSGGNSAWAYCYNSDWVATGWVIVPFTVSAIPPPSNLSSSCLGNGTSASMSWTLPSGYSLSYARVQDNTTGVYVGGIPEQWPDSGPSLSITGTPGHNYTWWVHTRVLSGVYSNAVYGSFTCAIPGGWCGWSGWGACSVSACGLTGTQTRTRTCACPVPAYGGAQCSGSFSESQSCSTAACPDFTLNNSNAIHITLLSGGPSQTSDNTTITVIPANGFNSNVTLSASSDISGATYNFATNPFTSSSYSTGSVFNVTVPVTTPKGPHTITIQGVDGGLIRTVFGNVILNVESYNPGWIEF